MKSDIIRFCLKLVNYYIIEKIFEKYSINYTKFNTSCIDFYNNLIRGFSDIAITVCRMMYFVTIRFTLILLQFAGVSAEFMAKHRKMHKMKNQSRSQSIKKDVCLLQWSPHNIQYSPCLYLLNPDE